MKTSKRDTSFPQIRHMDSPRSKYQRKTATSDATSLITDHWTRSPDATLPHSLTWPSALKTCRAWNYSANSTYVGGTTISGSAKRINGKRRSRHVEDSLNQESCFSAWAIHQDHSNALSTTSWNLGTGNLDERKAKTTWTTSALAPNFRNGNYTKKW